MAICPYCEHSIHRVMMERITCANAASDALIGVAYSCPECGKTLSVQIDPVAIKAETVAEIEDLFGDEDN